MMLASVLSLGSRLCNRSSSWNIAVSWSRTREFRPGKPGLTRPYHVGEQIEPPLYNVSQPITPQPWLYPMNLDDSIDMAHILCDYDTFLFDCDGVLWGTDHFTKFGNVKRCLTRLLETNKRVLFVTNNSMHSRQAYLAKFMEMCDFQVDIDQIFSVNYATALYLKHIAKLDGRIYAMGSKGLTEELDNLGLDSFGYGPDPDEVTDHRDELLQQRLDPEVCAVVVGFDIHVGYNKIYKAASYLSDPQCVYLATNDVETRVQIGPRHILPLTGVLTVAVNAASNRLPTVIGKPYHHLMSCMLSTYPDIDRHRTLMIGDSIKTDIGFASNIGVDSILVLSGSTKMEDVLRYHGTRDYDMPTFILSSIEKLGAAL